MRPLHFCIVVLFVTLAMPLPARQTGIDFADLEKCGITPSVVTYKSTADGDLQTQVYLPAESPTGEARATLVFVHGGGWTAGTNANHRLHSRYFAARGMVVFNLRYRLIPNSGDGLTLFDQVGDVRSAIRWIRHHAADYDVDPTRIAIVGESAGGHLAACAAFIDAFDDPNDSTELSATPDLAILLNPITDLPRIPWFSGHAAQVGERPLPVDDTPIDDPLDETIHPARRLSPLFYAHRGNPPPSLFVHGEADTVVPFAQSESMHQALLAAGHDSELIALPRTNHAFFIPGYGSAHAINSTLLAMDRFLEAHGYIEDPPALLGYDIDWLENGGFEHDLSRWSGHGGTRIEAVGATAGSAAFLRSSSSEAMNLALGFELSEAHIPSGVIERELLVANLSGYLRAAEISHYNDASIILRFFDATGSLAAEFSPTRPILPGTGTWIPVDGAILVPRSARSVEVVLATHRAVPVDFDEIALTFSSTTRATTYADWQSYYFSPEEIADSAISGPETIPDDGTRLSHFVRYATRQSRHAAVWLQRFEFEARDGPNLRFLLDPFKTDVHYGIESGAGLDPETWIPVFDSATEELPLDAFSTAKYPLGTTEPTWFGRLSIEMTTSEDVP